MESNSLLVGPTNNLWELATKGLLPEEIEYIDFDNPKDQTALVVLRQLLQETEEEKEQWMKRRWMIPRTNKPPIIPREKINQIIFWIERFIQIGDCAMQYDPAHAALPWAGVRLILKITVNEHQAFDTVLEGMERISNLICRYAVFEALYLNPQLKVYMGLKRALTELYEAVLKYLSKVKRFYAKRSAARLAGSILKDGGRDFEILLQDIIEKESEVDHLAPIADRESQNAMNQKLDYLTSDQRANHLRLKSLLIDLLKPLDEINSKISELYNELQTTKQREVLRWISNIPFRQHHENIRQDRLESSGLWLFEKEPFKEWRESKSSSILWLRGIPGSGKTKLSSLVIDQLQQEMNWISMPLVYFYCARNTAEPERGDPREILRSILRQLSCPAPGLSIWEPAQRKYMALQHDGCEPRKLTLDETRKLIVEISKTFSLITIIIDALNECNPDTRADLLDALKDIVLQSEKPMRILVSSQDDKDLVSQLSDSLHVHIRESDNAGDIKRFVEDQVEKSIRKKKLLGGKVPAELKQHLKSTLVDNAHGMFRWVSLQLQSICRPGILLEGDVREKLRHPPQNLTAMYSEVYNQMYSQLGPESQQIMKRVLKWLLCAQRQLSTDELLAAVSIKSSKEFTRVSKQDVLDMCYNFVVLDNEMDIFRFTHLSVREYLEGCEEYSVALAHSLAAEKCLLLCLATPSDYKRPESAVAKARSFRDYAMLHWVTHCQMSDHYRHEGTLGQLFNKFVHRNPLVSPSFQEWTQSAQLRMQSTAWNDPLKARIESAFSSPPDPFFAACAWGFLDLVESSLRSRKIITHITNSRGHAGLRIASDYDQNDVVQFLLNEGADVMAKAKDGSTALHVAVGRGNSKATSLLLGKGAKIEAKDESGRTPLHKASETGNEETLRLLLENGANPSATHNGGWTPLHCAAEKGNEAAVMLLLDNEKLVDLEVEDEFGCTALYLAAERGHEQVVQHLLGKNAVVDAVDSYGGTALGQAVENGHKGIVRLLLEAHADVNKCGALQRAAERGNDEILPLLIEYGADIEAMESPGIQALHMASERGHMTAVEQLIKRGADIESKDYYGRTPLYHAAAGGYERVVQLLLDNGADIMTGDMDMKTPLHEAAARGHGPAVQLLLGKLGRRPPETDNSGKTALDWAIEGQHMAVVGLFESQV